MVKSVPPAFSVLFVLGLVLATCFSAAHAQPRKDGVDDVRGARWGYTITRDRKTVKGEFRVLNHEVFQNGRKVGDVRPKGSTETVIVINGVPELNGRAVLTKTDTKPPVWKGELKRANGNVWPIEVIMTDR